MRHRWVLPVLAVLIVEQGSLSPQQPALEARGRALVRSGVSLPFVENRGVYPEAVRFYAMGEDRTVFLTAEGVTFHFRGRSAVAGQGGAGHPWTVKLDLVGAREGVEPRGDTPADAVVSYFGGPRDRWRTGLRTFLRVVYPEVWPGIDLVYELRDGRLKYDAIVKPGARVDDVRLRYRGAERIERTPGGGLRVITPAGVIEERPPCVYQDVEGERLEVEATLHVVEGDEPDSCAVRFLVGAYDPKLPLVVDPPILLYCGYIGPAFFNYTDLAVDALGNAYVTGSTRADEKTFPVRVGPDLTFNSWDPRSTDAFVAKVKSDGSGLEYCGYIGGQGEDIGFGVAVDAAGAAYVVGRTDSLESNFPVIVGPDLTQNGAWDGFIAKVTPDGRQLEYCGYIGGGTPAPPELATDWAWSVAVDAAGAAYVVGQTQMDERSFPVRLGPRVTKYPDLSHDAYIAKVNPRGTALDYCGYIGGLGAEAGLDVAVDASGAAYVLGDTTSSEATFPVRVGPDLTHNAKPPFYADAFVAKVTPDGRSLVYCGYIGGDRGALSSGIAVDRLGRAYVVGGTHSTEASFPVRGGPDLTHNDGGNNGDAFVARVSASGAALEYCGYIGGAGVDGAEGVAVDHVGRAYVSGSTTSPEASFPVKLGPSLRFGGGIGDGFVARLNPSGTALDYCGYVGGAAWDLFRAIGIDDLGNNVFVAGITWSDERSLPVRVGPDLTFNGATDVFVARIVSTQLTSTGAPRAGGTVTFSLMDDPGLPYQLGSSLGAGPTPIGARAIGLGVDGLLAVSTSGVLPSVFSGYAGLLDASGRAQASVRIPNAPALVGQVVHSAFVTWKPSAPLGVYSISDPVSFRITTP